MTPTNAEIEALKAKAEAATPNEWHASTDVKVWVEDSNGVLICDTDNEDDDPQAVARSVAGNREQASRIKSGAFRFGASSSGPSLCPLHPEPPSLRRRRPVGSCALSSKRCQRQETRPAASACIAGTLGEWGV